MGGNGHSVNATCTDDAVLFVLGLWIRTIVTGITLALGITMSAQYLMLLFAIASLISWVLLRQVFKLPKGNVQTFDHDINDN